MDGPAPARLRYLALGDSYTIGEGVAPEARWPAQWARQLAGCGLAVAAPHIVARTGWSVDELLAGIHEAALRPEWDLVSLLVGVNDQYRGYPVDGYTQRWESALAQALDLVGGDARRAFALSIPDWGISPFARAQGRAAAQVAEEIDAYNDAARRACAHRAVAYFDITAVSRQPPPGVAWWAVDGLHPSAAQYGCWVQHIVPPSRAMLASLCTRAS